MYLYRISRRPLKGETDRETIIFGLGLGAFTTWPIHQQWPSKAFQYQESTSKCLSNIKKVHQSVFPNVVFGSSENMSMKSDLFTFGSLRWPPIILCVYQSSVACFEGDSQRRQFVGKIKKYFWKNLNLPPRLLKKYVERR